MRNSLDLGGVSTSANKSAGRITTNMIAHREKRDGEFALCRMSPTLRYRIIVLCQMN